MYVCILLTIATAIKLQYNKIMQYEVYKREDKKKRIKEQKVMMVTLNKITKKVLLNDLKRAGYDILQKRETERV